MARIPCLLQHSLRLSRDSRWGEAYRAPRRPEPEIGAGAPSPRTGSAAAATVIRLEDRRQHAGA